MVWSVKENRLLQAHIDEGGLRRGFYSSACAVLPDRTMGLIRYKVRRLQMRAQIPVTTENTTRIDEEIQELTVESERAPLYTEYRA